jgi:hypothetical protein
MTRHHHTDVVISYHYSHQHLFFLFNQFINLQLPPISIQLILSRWCSTTNWSLEMICCMFFSEIVWRSDESFPRRIRRLRNAKAAKEFFDIAWIACQCLVCILLQMIRMVERKLLFFSCWRCSERYH